MRKRFESGSTSGMLASANSELRGPDEPATVSLASDGDVGAMSCPDAKVEKAATSKGSIKWFFIMTYDPPFFE